MTPRSYHSPRRQEDAAGTRRDIVDAARRLFAAQGYARVPVAEIAAAAGVSVKTVYASVGNKPEILAEIISLSIQESDATASLERVRASRDLRGVVAELAAGIRKSTEGSQDAIDIIYSALGAHEVADRAWQQSTTAFRAALREAADHLVALGAVRDGLSAEKVGDVLWLSFGFGAWRSLVRDCGWSWDAAEEWLREQAYAVLDPGRAVPDRAGAGRDSRRAAGLR
ncbi:TetR/AcrR family transcriptional regulator [Kribbella italica]|uniref:AcrR family transcriptional regulator n=1 Tax=Kribbella italica TaxID=1540520 RepID=A0A7W9JCG7_9ACTN|nr:TetR/AcrR family transcriptional regulator [Kribbella italica]MBB5839602.1 AcrR family transcriptional regulator [Kribbella italica]